MICQDEKLIDENVERVIQGKPLTHSLAYLDGTLKRKIGINQLPAEVKAYQKAYRQTDKYKAYRQTDKYKAYQKAYQKAYWKTDKYKAYQKAYRQRKKKEVKA